MLYCRINQIAISLDNIRRHFKEKLKERNKRWMGNGGEGMTYIYKKTVITGYDACS